MPVNNIILYDRTLSLLGLRHSAFLFGPRATGKTSLLKKFSAAAYYDLLNPEIELGLRANPRRFWEEISLLKPGQWVIVDEVQRVTSLLDFAQMGIEDLKLKFLLSGSSARKLKRGGANLLGGRALDLRIHPLTHEEIGEEFSEEIALSYGTLPKIYAECAVREVHSARALLRSYLTTYIKEEIQAEAIVRKLDAFQRFLDIAGQCNGQVIEFANISRESSVAMSTVKDFYQILEDTLIGRFLWPYDRSERKKARPRFYFFDCGVVRALQGRLNDAPTSQERGGLFETWFVNEVMRLNDYHELDLRFSLWRRESWEIDLIVEKRGRPALAVEIKTGRHFRSEPSWAAFQSVFPKKVPLIVASLDDERSRKFGAGIEVLPFKVALQRVIAV